MTMIRKLTGEVLLKKHSPSFLSQVLLLSYYYLVGNLPPTFNKQLISYKERFVIEQGEKCIDY